MSEINTKSVGEFLTALRKSKGMTQQEVADRLCVTNKAISRWECGDGYPEITILPAVAELYGVTVDEILKGARISPDNAAAQERAQANTQKQVKRFTRKLSDFCLYAAIIAAVVMFIGLLFILLAFTVNGLVGTIFYLIFLLLAVIIQIFSILRTNSRLADNEMLEEFPELAEGVKKKLALYSLHVFSFILLSLCFTVFLIFSAGTDEYVLVVLALWISPWLAARQIVVGILRKKELLPVNGKKSVSAAFVVLSTIMALAPVGGVVTEIIIEQFPQKSYTEEIKDTATFSEEQWKDVQEICEYAKNKNEYILEQTNSGEFILYAYDESYDEHIPTEKTYNFAFNSQNFAIIYLWNHIDTASSLMNETDMTITYVMGTTTVTIGYPVTPVMLTSFAVSAVSAVALAVIERKKKN